LRDHYRTVEKTIASDRGQSEGGAVLTRVMLAEERSWGGCMVGAQAVSIGLGNAAINAVATEEPEPSCGSDTAAIQTTARLERATCSWPAACC
jgi:hypothetical protein